MDAILILTTLPDPDLADTLARTLVDEREAACVNRIGPLHSIYRWDGQREENDEYLLLIKTRSELYEAVEKRIHTLHPYTLPEVVMIHLDRVEPRYLAWLGASVTTEPQ